MAGIVIIFLSFFIGWLGGVFTSTKNRKKVLAEIVKVTHSYNKKDRHPDCIVELKYNIDNKVYREKTKKLSPTSKVGKNVAIYCMKDNPRNFIIKADASVYVIMIFVFIIGAAIFFKSVF